MPARTTRSTIRFDQPFVLQGMDGSQPPGDYRIERDEESVGETSRLAWRCVATFIHLPAIGVESVFSHMVRVEASELAAARDAGTGGTSGP